jgi:hypothetical protein
MNKIDDMIGKALTEEDRALLASHSEPGYLAQAFGIFRGPMAGIMWMVNVASGVAAIAALYAIWRMVGASEVLMAVKWGVAALALFQVTSLCKTFMANRMEANRLLRELKRVELQVAMLRDKPGLAG